MRSIRIDYDRLRGATAGKGVELAKKLDIHQTSFSRKMTGKIPLTFDDINQIARHLGVDADRFIEVYEIDSDAAD